MLIHKLSIFFLFFYTFLFAQIDSSKVATSSIVNMKLNYKSIIIPSVLIGYGVLATDNGQLNLFNLQVRKEVGEHIDNKISIDDFSQYAPLITNFSLEALGINGKNSLKDKAIITATSYLIMGVTVNAIKNSADVQRPDLTSYKSFPSGHTATAFMGAELLHQEYKNVSLWYSFSGYFIATGTGLFRMLNNRHWLSDVVAGAGIGIISAKAGYWLYPTIKKIIKPKQDKNKTVFVPYYNGKNAGFGLITTF